MAKRYLDLLSFIDANDPDIVSSLLSPNENLQLKSLFPKLEQLDAVTKKLQDETLNLSEAHVLFDHVMTMFPGFQGYNIILEPVTTH